VSHPKSLPIIEAAYSLALDTNRAVVKFPRHQRPGLGRRLEEAAFELLAALVKARYLQATDPAKAALLVQASQALDTLRILVRMAKDLEHLPLKRYEELSRTMRDVGRMLGGWQKSTGGQG